MSIIAYKDVAPGICAVLVDHDPMVGATNVCKGSLIYSELTGEWYVKRSDGENTDVNKIETNPKAGVAAPGALIVSGLALTRTTSSLAGWGLLDTFTISAAMISHNMTTWGRGQGYKTLSDDTTAYWASPQNNTKLFDLRRFPVGRFIWQCPSGASYNYLTNARFFAGFDAIGSDTVLRSDDPSGVYVGIQYSDPRDDTNYQFVLDDGTTQQKEDTGVAATANKTYILVIDGSPSEVTLKLLEIDSTTFAETEVASHTFDSDLMSQSTEMRSIMGHHRVSGAGATKHNVFFSHSLGLRR